MADTLRQVLVALETGDLPTLEVLVATEPELLNAPDAGGVSVMMAARYRWDGPTVQAMLRPDQPMDVFQAATFGRATVLASILRDEPDAARAWSADGFTALHFAAFFGGEAVARLLLDAGADPDAESQNAMRVRPLHSAVAGGQTGVALALIAAQADVDAAQRHGWTPLQGAAEHGMADVVDALLAAGADPSATNDDGVDAATLADAKGHGAIAVAIRAAGAT